METKRNGAHSASQSKKRFCGIDQSLLHVGIVELEVPDVCWVYTVGESNKRPHIKVGFDALLVSRLGNDADAALQKSAEQNLCFASAFVSLQCGGPALVSCGISEPLQRLSGAQATTAVCLWALAMFARRVACAHPDS